MECIIDKSVLVRISEVALIALGKNTAEKIITRKGHAKELTMMFLSMIAGGRCSKLRTSMCDVSALVLNDSELQKKMLAENNVNTEESSIAAIIFMRLSNKEYAGIPKTFEIYEELIEALRTEDYKNPKLKELV